MAYVTCSPHPAETRAVVDDVLKTRARAGKPGAERLDTAAILAEITGAERVFGPGPDVQLWTDVHGTDAMFMSLIVRPAE